MTLTSSTSCIVITSAGGQQSGERRGGTAPAGAATSTWTHTHMHCMTACSRPPCTSGACAEAYGASRTVMQAPSQESAAGRTSARPTAVRPQDGLQRRAPPLHLRCTPSLAMPRAPKGPVRGGGAPAAAGAAACSTWRPDSGVNTDHLLTVVSGQVQPSAGVGRVTARPPLIQDCRRSGRRMRCAAVQPPRVSRPLARSSTPQHPEIGYRRQNFSAAAHSCGAGWACIHLLVYQMLTMQLH
jgi:hypothetical protein